MNLMSEIYQIRLLEFKFSFLQKQRQKKRMDARITATKQKCCENEKEEDDETFSITFLGNRFIGIGH